MTKTELIAVLAENTGLSNAKATEAFNAVFASMTDTLAAGNAVTIHGFGKFELSQRAARQGRNPQSGETIEIAASTSVKFKPVKALKDAVNK